MSEFPVQHAAAPPPPPDPAPESVEAFDALPAVVEMPPVAIGDGLNDLRRFWKIGRWLAMTEGDLTPEGNARAAMRLYWAEEFGLPASASRLIHIQRDGRITLGAELLRAMAERDGYRVLRRDSDDTRCTAMLVRQDGSVVGSSTYTIDQAEQAGLLTKTNWKQHPADMLWARASTRVLKDYAPRIALGIEDVEGYAPAAPDLDYVGEHDPAPETDEDIPF